MKKKILRGVILGVVVCAIALWVVSGKHPNRIEGYVEGEYLHLSSAVGGVLGEQRVQRGARVEQGAVLAQLDATPYRAAVDQLEAEVAAAQSLYKNRQQDFERTQHLLAQDIATQEDFDAAQSLRDQAEHSVRAKQAALEKSRWELSQTTLAAPSAGRVFDVLYRQGEYVKAGSPIVELLPARNVLVRAFVPQSVLDSVSLGQVAEVWVDGAAEPYQGAVAYISDKAEYTPPVIYSYHARQKFMWRVEIAFDPKTVAALHPGQPVEIKFKK